MQSNQCRIPACLFLQDIRFVLPKILRRGKIYFFPLIYFSDMTLIPKKGNSPSSLPFFARWVWNDERQKIWQKDKYSEKTPNQEINDMSLANVKILFNLKLIFLSRRIYFLLVDFYFQKIFMKNHLWTAHKRWFRSWKQNLDNTVFDNCAFAICNCMTYIPTYSLVSNDIIVQLDFYVNLINLLIRLSVIDFQFLNMW